MALAAEPGHGAKGERQDCAGREISSVLCDHLEGWDREGGVSRYKLLYREQINSKVLVYSTESYIQYHMINHNGKEY